MRSRSPIPPTCPTSARVAPVHRDRVLCRTRHDAQPRVRDHPLLPALPGGDREGVDLQQRDLHRRPGRAPANDTASATRSSPRRWSTSGPRPCRSRRRRRRPPTPMPAPVADHLHQSPRAPDHRHPASRPDPRDRPGDIELPRQHINPSTVTLDGVHAIAHITRKVRRDEFPTATYVFVAEPVAPAQGPEQRHPGGHAG